jgi:hypothetical protein
MTARRDTPMFAIRVESFQPTAAGHAAACAEAEAHINGLCYEGGTGSAFAEVLSVAVTNVGGGSPWRFTIVLGPVQR